VGGRREYAMPAGIGDEIGLKLPTPLLRGLKGSIVQLVLAHAVSSVWESCGLSGVRDKPGG